MKVTKAVYLGSFPRIHACPKTKKPEYAFIGRSNVGKSSLINMLCARKALAKVSNKPGKTQLLNYFEINEQWVIVDLPGYGYAQRSKSLRKSWEKMIADFLKLRENLQCAFILLDSNLPPQKIDMDFINWMGEMHIPFVITYTKSDRLSDTELPPNIERIRTEILQTWHELPREFISSIKTQAGKKEILSFIEEVNARFYK